MLLHNVTWAEPIAGEGKTPLIFSCASEAERQGSAVPGNVETWRVKVFSVKERVSDTSEGRGGSTIPRFLPALL